jgi:hypothetical protein
MLRALEDLARRTELNDSTRIHDSNPIGEARDYREVVGHVDHRHPYIGPQPHKFFEQSRLCDDVEASSWFVQDDDRRFADKCNRDTHALLLAAGELVGKSRLKLVRAR